MVWSLQSTKVWRSSIWGLFVKRFWVIAAIGLVTAACGGTVVESGDDATATTAPADDGAPAATSAPATQAPATAVNVATVTIGDKTYEADVDPEELLQRCDPDFFGGFWALGGGVEISLPPPDDPVTDDPPRVTVKDEASGLEWIADPSASSLGSLSGDDYDFKIPEGDSQVDSYTFDGNTATGTATFIEQEAYYQWTGGGDQPEPVQGAFEVTCGES